MKLFFISIFGPGVSLQSSSMLVQRPRSGVIRKSSSRETARALRPSKGHRQGMHKVVHSEFVVQIRRLNRILTVTSMVPCSILVTMSTKL
ncbi:MAG: hypothetical protein CM1200mP35_01840 [Chloroflexota bacterium]|nr:MAG: hypothetical protein CM1200mP35_01840 [Chloroflexota bacterium]